MFALCSLGQKRASWSILLFFSQNAKDVDITLLLVTILFEPSSKWDSYDAKAHASYIWQGNTYAIPYTFPIHIMSYARQPIQKG